MPEHEDDLRTFIRHQTARMDRSYRDLAKVIDRNTETQDRVIKRLDDQHDERRAVIDALFLLIDEIRELGRRINPGGEPGAAST